MYRCITESLCCTHKTNPTLYINYTSIKKYTASEVTKLTSLWNAIKQMSSILTFFNFSIEFNITDTLFFETVIGIALKMVALNWIIYNVKDIWYDCFKNAVSMVSLSLLYFICSDFEKLINIFQAWFSLWKMWTKNGA